MDRAAWRARVIGVSKSQTWLNPCVHMHVRVHTHTYTHTVHSLRWWKSHLWCPFPWRSEMSAGLVLIILVLTTLHQDLTMFLPGELSHLLQVNIIGKWTWRAVASGLWDFVMVLDPGRMTRSLTRREFFCFFGSNRTLSAGYYPLSTSISICQKVSGPGGGVPGLWWWCCEFACVSKSCLICSFLYCSFCFPLNLFLFSGHHWWGRGQNSDPSGQEFK